MHEVRFSIVVTCYNQSEFIGAALDSALAQSKSTKNEVIVVDDGSRDGSPAVLESYAESIRLVTFPENQGAIAARNHGAGLATGEYLVFLDGDDALMPWALDVYERIVVSRHPKVILGQALWFEGPIPQLKADDGPQNVQFVEYEAFLRKDRPAGLSASTYVVDRQAFWNVGGWSPGIFHLDLQDLSTKLAYSGHMILICAPSTALYRIHSANSIHSVAPFLRMVHFLLGKEKAGLYPGGREHLFERYAWFGGLAVFWIKRAARAGLYTDALYLGASGWLMILAAICRRSMSWLRGRRPVESLSLQNP